VPMLSEGEGKKQAVHWMLCESCWYRLYGMHTCLCALFKVLV
jgi:hypothetical protein